MAAPDTGAEGLIRARYVLQHQGGGFRLELDTHWPATGITALFGRSGSGKTTLLRCIAGLDKPDVGFFALGSDVWQDHHRWTPPHQRPVGYVFQEASLFPHLSAQGNLAFARKRSPSPVAVAEYDRIVTLLGIEALLSRYPAQLSGGERQRVAIARALLVQPRLLLMDEPLASLDQERKQQILPYLERLRAELQLPILYVTHAVPEVARLADHVLVMDNGRLVAQGPPPEVFSHLPVSLPAGEETGTILDGRIAAREPQWQLSRLTLAGGGDLWISDDGKSPGEPVRIRILASDVSLALRNHDDSSILNRLPARVLDIAADKDGAMALVRLQVGGQCLLARLTRRSVQHLGLAPGMELWALIKSAAIVR